MEDGGWCNCADGIYIDGGTGPRRRRDNGWSATTSASRWPRRTPAAPPTTSWCADNVISRSGYVGIATGGYSPSRGEVYGVRVTGNHFRDDNTLRDGSPELLLQFKLHETSIVGNTVVATHRATPLLLQRNRLVGPRRLNAHVRLDHNHYVAPVRAARAQFVWLGHRFTGFRAYVRGSRQDDHSRYAWRRR